MTRPSDVSPVSRDEFIHNLQQSGLFSSDDLPRLLADLPPDAEGAALAQALAAQDKLTPYQAEVLLKHRFERLRVGNYDLLDRLGAGAMGTVFKARHRRMKRLVAIKVLPAELAGRESFVQRFQREVQTIARLSHPNIVMAFDADEAEIGPFLVMEFVNGRDLAGEVQQGGPLSLADAVNCTLQAGRGLAYAHAQGIIHRDVKPANLLRDASGLIKVADLGLARLNVAEGDAGSSLTQAGGILGTADFMPPEQALDSTSIDCRADIYSLGCTLYLFVTGRPPYTAGSLMALLLKHRDAPIPSLRALRPETPPQLDALYQRMVAKQPDDRYATMDEVIVALESVEGAVRGLTQRPGIRKGPVSSATPLSDRTVAHDSAMQMQTEIGSTPPMSLSDVKRVADLTVVLVEPSRAQAAIIRKYLQQLSIERVHVVGAGRQALSLAQEEHAEVILSTMHLADMTGVQLGEMIHADAGCGDMGFVLTTSATDSVDADSLLKTPRTVLLAKPFNPRQLAGALATATGRTPADFPIGS